MITMINRADNYERIPWCYESLMEVTNEGKKDDVSLSMTEDDEESRRDCLRILRNLDYDVQFRDGDYDVWRCVGRSKTCQGPSVETEIKESKKVKVLKKVKAHSRSISFNEMENKVNIKLYPYQIEVLKLYLG